jgi:hypothetical protein
VQPGLLFNSSASGWFIKTAVLALVVIYSHALHNDISVNNGPHILRWSEFLKTPDKLTVEENYLPEQIFNMDKTCLFWKRMSERTFIRKETKSMPGSRFV